MRPGSLRRRGGAEVAAPTDSVESALHRASSTARYLTRTMPRLRELFDERPRGARMFRAIGKLPWRRPGRGSKVSSGGWCRRKDRSVLARSGRASSEALPGVSSEREVRYVALGSRQTTRGQVPCSAAERHPAGWMSRAANPPQLVPRQATFALLIVSALVTTSRSRGWVAACRFRQAM